MKNIRVCIFLLVSCFSSAINKPDTLGDKAFQSLVHLPLNGFVTEIDQLTPEQLKERSEKYLTKKIALFYTEQQKNKTVSSLEPNEFLYLKELKKDPIFAYLLDVKNISINLSIKDLLDAGYSFKEHIIDEKKINIPYQNYIYQKIFFFNNRLLTSLEGLETVPDIKKSQALELQGNRINNIETLKNKIFEKIEAINLAHNQIQKIENNTLRSLKNLNHLNLSNNPLPSELYTVIKDQVPKECSVILKN